MSSPNRSIDTIGDLLSFSHVRWRWEPQRPQHLLARAARDRRVIVVEEPAFEPGSARMEVDHPQANLVLLRPCLPYALADEDTTKVQRALLDVALRELDVHLGTLWYFTPMALLFSRHLRAPVVVYDCMEDSPAGAPAPDAVRLLERQLLRRADIVFTDCDRQFATEPGSNTCFHPSAASSHNGASQYPWHVEAGNQPAMSGAAGFASPDTGATPMADDPAIADATWDATWEYVSELLATVATRGPTVATRRARPPLFLAGRAGHVAGGRAIDSGK